MNETSETSETAETLEGYVVDLACIRKYAREDLLERARAHTRRCCLMGHCVESGYGLIGSDGRLAVLDARATPLVVAAVRASEREQGVRLRALREKQDEEMNTVHVEEV